MSAAAPLRRSRRRASISLTPLIDVVFILLVFFMLATSFVDWRVIPLSAVTEGAARPSLEGTVLVDLAPTEIRVGGKPLSESAFDALVENRIASHPEQRFLLRPRDGADMQRLVSLLDRLEALGVRQVDIAPGG